MRGARSCVEGIPSRGGVQTAWAKSRVCEREVGEVYNDDNLLSIRSPLWKPQDRT